jgi:hypothetical protein
MGAALSATMLVLGSAAAELDREPKPIGLGAMTIDQIEIGRRQRITLTYFQPIGWKCQQLGTLSRR